MEKQTENQTLESVFDKIQVLKDSKLPNFVKKNKEAKKLLSSFKIEFEKAQKAVDSLTPEQKRTPDEKWQNKELLNIYNEGKILLRIMENEQEFHYFCEVRERERRSKNGEPPTIWEFNEYLKENKIERE